MKGVCTFANQRSHFSANPCITARILFGEVIVSTAHQNRRITTTPITRVMVAIIRLVVNFSPRKNTPKKSANKTDVSRREETSATGAERHAQSTIT